MNLKKQMMMVVLGCLLGGAAMAQTGVVINKKELSSKELKTLKQQVGKVYKGSYWYDAKTGGWGYQGGPTVGFIPAGISIGGKLRADASNGIDGVYVNGRSLHRSEVLALKSLFGVVYPGRYWMDATGNYGVVGGVWLGNLVAQASQAISGNRYRYGTNGSTVNGNSFWHSDTTGNTVSSNSSGDFYIMGDGFSYSSF